MVARDDAFALDHGLGRVGRKNVDRAAVVAGRQIGVAGDGAALQMQGCAGGTADGRAVRALISGEGAVFNDRAAAVEVQRAAALCAGGIVLKDGILDVERAAVDIDRAAVQRGGGVAGDLDVRQVHRAAAQKQRAAAEVGRAVVGVAREQNAGEVQGRGVLEQADRAAPAAALAAGDAAGVVERAVIPAVLKGDGDVRGVDHHEARDGRTGRGDLVAVQADRDVFRGLVCRREIDVGVQIVVPRRRGKLGGVRPLDIFRLTVEMRTALRRIDGARRHDAQNDQQEAQEKCKGFLQCFLHVHHSL